MMGLEDFKAKAEGMGCTLKTEITIYKDDTTFPNQIYAFPSGSKPSSPPVGYYGKSFGGLFPNKTSVNWSSRGRTFKELA